MSAPLTWWQRAVMIVGALALIALGLHDVLLLFRRTREKGFIIQHSEYGDMSISMNALESMVQKCVASHQELTVNATHIQHAREGIVVDIKITLPSGVNIPLTVNALQKQIKQYITSCSGVDVHKVRVMVETDARALPIRTRSLWRTHPFPQRQRPWRRALKSRFSVMWKRRRAMLFLTGSNPTAARGDGGPAGCCAGCAGE